MVGNIQIRRLALALGLAVLISELGILAIRPYFPNNPSNAFSSEIQLGHIWERYSSSKANISFDYPSGWIITDIIFQDGSQNKPKQVYTYNSLWICPPGNQLIATTEEGVDNCIAFFTKNRLLFPPQELENEGAAFSDFTNYIKSASTDNSDIRIVEQQISSNRSIEIGLYQNNDNLVGISQQLCAKGMNAECLLMFKHVLDSINFLKPI